jgi:predicted ATPase
VLDAARLAVTLRRTRAGHLEHLRSSVDASIPLLYVPMLFTRGHGLRTTGQVAEALSDELGF